MFGALKHGFRSTASLILVRNVVGVLQPKRIFAASRGFLAAARLSCLDRQTMPRPPSGRMLLASSYMPLTVRSHVDVGYRPTAEMKRHPVPHYFLLNVTN